MARVDVQITNFNLPSRGINGRPTLDVSLPELVWGVVTVGAPNANAALGNILSGLAFTGHKALAICATLRSDGAHFVHPANYGDLDQSEKGVLSYLLGMAMAKVMASRVLQVPWLSHARHLKDEDILHLRPANTGMLPDLIGQDGTGAWHVIEAKARQKRAPLGDRAHWKAQARVVRDINSVSAVSRSYCLTLQDPMVRVELVDPEPGEEYIDLEVDVERLRQEYYRPYRELFVADGAARWRPEYDEDWDGEYRFATLVSEPLTGQRLELGFHSSLVESEFAEFSRVLETPPVHEDVKTYYGPDGIAVRLTRLEDTN